MSLRDRIVNISYQLKDKFTGQVAKISSGFKKIETASDKSSASIDKNNKKSTKSFFSLKKTVTGIGSAIATTFAGLAGVATGVFNATATFQKLNASLKTVTGSSEAATKAFDLISNFAKKTPFEITQVADAFIKLKALGLDPSEAALTSYGNTASAMGKSLNQMIEAVADATTGEFERLKEFGIKSKSQGDNVSFTFQGVTTTIKKNAKEIEKYLRGIGDVQFAGAMTEQMNTIGGQLSNLKDSFFRLAIEIGKSGASDATGSIMTDISNSVKQATKIVKENSGIIRDSFNAMVGSIKFFGNAFIIAFNALQIIMRGLVRAMFGFAADINTALSAITFGDTSREFKNNADAMRSVMKDIEKDIKNDADSANNALSRIGNSFNVDAIKKDVQKAVKNTQPEVEILARTDVQKAIADINKNIAQAQAQVKPIEIPVIYKNAGGTSVSADQPINTEINRAALTAGKR